MVRKGGIKRVGKKAKGFDAAEHFAQMSQAMCLPRVVREHTFALDIGRKWRMDFCYPDWNLAVEIEGLVVKRGHDGKLSVSGRHASISGFKEDAIKYAEAAIRGWYVMRFEQSMVKIGAATELVEKFLVSRGWQRG